MPKPSRARRKSDRVVLSPEALEEAIKVFKALGSSPRVEMLNFIESGPEGERSVGEIEMLFSMGQSAVSQQLRKLRDAGIVETRKERQRVFYRLTDTRVREMLRLLAR